MKNKKLKILAVIIPVFMIVLIIYLFFSFQNKKMRLKNFENIPVFALKTIDGKVFTNQDLNSENRKVVVYFSTDCHFCEAEVKELSKVRGNYEKTEWIWISGEPLLQIKLFAEKYKLNAFKNIHWCYDDEARFYKSFQMKRVPYFLVYDKNNHLIKRNSGAIKLTKLLDNSDDKY